MEEKDLCIYCGKNKPAGSGKYCSVCYRKYIKIPEVCERCQKIRVCISGFCMSCYNRWKKGWRMDAVKKNGYKCSNEDCEISKFIKIPKPMFDVDHITGRKNGNSADNLQLLCVWCHALKTRKIGGADIRLSKKD